MGVKTPLNPWGSKRTAITTTVSRSGYEAQEEKGDLMKGKVVQIIPAPSNLVIVSTIDGEIDEEPALCLALTNQGKILVMHIDGAGLIDEVHEAIDVDGFKWK